MPLKPSDVHSLIELFTHSEWDELRLEIDGDELLLSTDSNAQMTTPAATAAARPTAPMPPPASAASAISAAPPATRPRNWVCVKAPNLGTFYTSPAPDAAPYVTPGATVTTETEVCLIEVMKLFTTVRAGISGTVREIAAQDGDMVEYDQALLWIEPAA